MEDNKDLTALILASQTPNTPSVNVSFTSNTTSVQISATYGEIYKAILSQEMAGEKVNVKTTLPDGSIYHYSTNSGEKVFLPNYGKADLKKKLFNTDIAYMEHLPDLNSGYVPSLLSINADSDDEREKIHQQFFKFSKALVSYEKDGRKISLGGEFAREAMRRKINSFYTNPTGKGYVEMLELVHIQNQFIRQRNKFDKGTKAKIIHYYKPTFNYFKEARIFYQKTKPIQDYINQQIFIRTGQKATLDSNYYSAYESYFNQLSLDTNQFRINIFGEKEGVLPDEINNLMMQIKSGFFRPQLKQEIDKKTLIQNTNKNISNTINILSGKEQAINLIGRNTETLIQNTNKNISDAMNLLSRKEQATKIIDNGNLSISYIASRVKLLANIIEEQREKYLKYKNKILHKQISKQKLKLAKSKTQYNIKYIKILTKNLFNQSVIEANRMQSNQNIDNNIYREERKINNQQQKRLEEIKQQNYIQKTQQLAKNITIDRKYYKLLDNSGDNDDVDDGQENNKNIAFNRKTMSTILLAYLFHDVKTYLAEYMDLYWETGGSSSETISEFASSLKAIISPYTTLHKVLRAKISFKYATDAYNASLQNIMFNEAGYYRGGSHLSLEDNYNRWKSLMKSLKLSLSQKEFYVKNQPFYELYQMDKEDDSVLDVVFRGAKIVGSPLGFAMLESNFLKKNKLFAKHLKNISSTPMPLVINNELMKQNIIDNNNEVISIETKSIYLKPQVSSFNL